MFWKKKKQENNEFKCSICNEVHEEWPALAFVSPFHYNQLSKDEKDESGFLNSDFCEITYKDQVDRFIRVVLYQEVNGYSEKLNYGLWVSLSKKSFEDYKENYDDPNQEAMYFGWMASWLPEYNDMTQIPMNVYCKGDNRPEVIPHNDHDHPFVHDYLNGISKEEAEKRIHDMMRTIE